MTQPTQQTTRRSRDDVWPLRNADGLTFAEAKAARDRKEQGK